jgi:hypothetical protein
MADELEARPLERGLGEGLTSGFVGIAPAGRKIILEEDAEEDWRRLPRGEKIILEKDAELKNPARKRFSEKRMRNKAPNCALRHAKPLRYWSAHEDAICHGSVTGSHGILRKDSEVQACGLANPSDEKTTAFTLRDTVETGSGGGP